MTIMVVPRPLRPQCTVPGTRVMLSTCTFAHPIRLRTTQTVWPKPDHANDLRSSRLHDGRAAVNKTGVGPAPCEVSGCFSFRPPCLSDLGEGPRKQPLDEASREIMVRKGYGGSHAREQCLAKSHRGQRWQNPSGRGG